MSESVDRSGVRVFPPLISVAAIGVGVLLQWVVAVGFVPEGLRAAVRVAGWGIVVVSVALMVTAVALFRRAGTTPNPTKPTTALVFRGPYRFTRNPMYLGWAGVITAVALLTNNAWMLAMTVGDVILTRKFVIDLEERYLAAKFGDAYREYTGKVRRWI